MIETHSKGRSSEETCNLYRQKYEAQIREWNARVEELHTGGPELGARARLERQPRPEAVRKRYEVTRSRLRELASAADDTWEDLERNAGRAWMDLESSVEGAYEALKQRRPSQQEN